MREALKRMELEQQQQSYRAVVDRVASPAHHVQDVVGPVHFTVDAVQDCVVCSGHTHTHTLYLCHKGRGVTGVTGVAYLCPWLSFFGSRQAAVRGNG